MELLDHTIILCLIFWGTTILFSTVATPSYILTSNAQGFQCVSISFVCLNKGHPNGYEVVLIVVLISISIIISIYISIAICMCPLENLCSLNPLPIFKCHFILFYFCCWVVAILHIFWILTPHKVYELQIFSPILWFAFLLCWEYPWMHKYF